MITLVVWQQPFWLMAVVGRWLVAVILGRWLVAVSASARSQHIAMEGRWSLRDFGCMQFLWDGVSGEYIKVFGRGAVTDQGPWELFPSEGGELLRSVCAEADPATVVDPAKLASLQITTNGDGELVVPRADADDNVKLIPLAVWRKQNSSESETKVLVFPVDGYPSFKCEFYWEKVPRMCGDQPVSLWVSWKWLVDFILGKKAVAKAWRYAQYLETHLESLGLAATHVVRSQRCGERFGEKPAAQEEAKPAESNQVRVSMLAALLFLEDVTFSGGKYISADNKADDIGSKAKAVLKAWLLWPRHSESTIALALSRTPCEMLITGLEVDGGVLAESEQHTATHHNSRIDIV